MIKALRAVALLRGLLAVGCARTLDDIGVLIISEYLQ